ncbi:sugar transferase [Marinitoga sp. 38H-ov]|uniref:sugar transferase n=1 Tax=Marinitoga sp. 38H-ov TaxID=1755814 RepID=UPI0013EB2142|nr:sugar transferase [Marinitoga sp. 38H-ov]KAF2955585.1 hypothetical protein AS160_09440 [Marinitoga sp. 38H-ov]
MNIAQKRTIKRGIKKTIYGIILLILDYVILVGLYNVFNIFDMNIVYFYSGILSVIYLFRKMYYFETHLFWDELLNIFHSTAIYFFVILVLLLFSGNYIDIFKLFVLMFMFIILDSLTRYIFRKILIKFKLFSTNVIILGIGELAQVVYDKISQHPFTTYNIIGFLKYNDDKIIVDKNKIIGDLDDFNKIIKKNNIEEVIIAIPNLSKFELSKIITKFERMIRKIKYIPDLYGLISFSNKIHDLDGILAITASQELLNPLNLIIKRIFDIVLSIIGLILLSPVFLIIAILIKKEDKGPVFFKHKRIGKNLEEFEMYKFRTMYPDAEKRLEELLEKDEKIREEWYKHFKLKNDPRITKIGKILRKTSLDELPQLINVLIGNMSLIGPRPVVRKEVELYYGEDVAKEVFSIKPGITGMWQANGRSDIEDYSERIALDLYYLRNWSLELDFIIFLKTIKIVIDKKGAY